MKAHTTFIGNANDAEAFRAEWSELTGYPVAAQQMDGGSWFMDVYVTEEKYDDLNMGEDWIISTPEPQVGRVVTIGDLRKALEQFGDNDQVVVEIHEGVRHEDLYTLYVDHVDALRDAEGNEFKEVRLCI